ncbi:MAG: hydroxymethylglutaryl-CoA reductase [Desulfobulbus sp.]|jgi:hydroxymethylglutaryl-CoA reductase (NADPH)|uniref:hydroxymethylglutaryl-CoA reductase n=1 Tax=Desulfobulbus sp. TaxID=895 RepID=UPI0028434D3D|nr:hydroxymethylglutaryl-CoA reductase [Desulfobulbus sp.]MDR2548614.1 hydroxymethylglutaryl-CoA reductase [Desulfobulbus sp.]
MTQNSHKIEQLAATLLGERSQEEVRKRLEADTKTPYARLANVKGTAPEALRSRWEDLLGQGRPIPSALYNGEDMDVYGANIENCIGTVKLPVGIAGPLRVNGSFAKGDYYLPLATTEAALVASYHRGAVILSKSGGCSAVILAEGVTRSPGFAFASIGDMLIFAHWVLTHKDKLKEVAATTTRFGVLQDIRFAAQGSHLYLLCDFFTGDAAGQNMVTIATQVICDFIIEQAPVAPQYWFVEANASGDKKATAQSFSTVRGKKVAAEAVIPGKYIERFLHTTPEKMVRYWQMSALGGVMTGTIGVQGHYANGLAALFIACGQDAACVAEAAVGITRFAILEDNGLYVSATLPNMIVGTVGGGTKLPSQQAALQLMGLDGAGHARAFAEVCAAAALAGEISIIGSMAAGDFTKAHDDLARKR